MSGLLGLSVGLAVGLAVASSAFLEVPSPRSENLFDVVTGVGIREFGGGVGSRPCLGLLALVCFCSRASLFLVLASSWA